MIMCKCKKVIIISLLILLLIVLENYILLHVTKCRDIKSDNGRHPLKASTTHLDSRKLQYQSYSLIPKALCPDDTHVLVVAISHIHSHTTRNKIRKCWKGEIRSSDCHWIMCSYNIACELSKLRLVFVTGKSSNNTVQKNLEEEHSQFDDIIQGNFYETYENLVHKSILLLDYAVNHCKSARYVQKIDDDVHLNMSAVNHILKQHPDTPEGYAIGYKISGVRVRRGGKWKLSKTELQSDYYPDYVIGASYILSKNATAALLNIAKKQPLIHVEDVFMGICISKTNIDIIHSSKFCLHKGRKNCAIMHQR